MAMTAWKPVSPKPTLLTGIILANNVASVTAYTATKSINVTIFFEISSGTQSNTGGMFFYKNGVQIYGVTGYGSPIWNGYQQLSLNAGDVITCRAFSPSAMYTVDYKIKIYENLLTS